MFGPSQGGTGRMGKEWISILFIIVILVFLSLTLVGCIGTSPLIPELFLIKLIPNGGSSFTEVRVGYYGICAVNGKDMICKPSNSASAFAPNAKVRRAGGDILSIAFALQGIYFSWLLSAAGAAFALSLPAIFLWRRKPQGRRYKPALVLVWLAAILAVAATVSVVQITNTLKYYSTLVPDQTVTIHPGMVTQILQAAACALAFLFAVLVLWIRWKDTSMGGGMGGGFGGDMGGMPPPM
ncbi:MAG: hypothetical protein M1839_007415 [Geoglossum umbratile]|nr:MAG: hypothetical protein M1839_007415 [Geoglossum umbratile]